MILFSHEKMQKQRLVRPGLGARKGTGYRGVRRRSSGKWVAEIRRPGERNRHYLGSFDTAEQAALAYDQAARRIYGDAARQNFPEAAAAAWEAIATDEAATAAAEAEEAQQAPGHGRETGDTAAELQPVTAAAATDTAAGIIYYSFI